MRSILLFLLVVIPYPVFADCILTEFPYSVVCSGYDPTAPPIKKVSKIAKGSRRGKTNNKVGIADGEGITSALGMTEEELAFMQTNNKMDGYKGKKKPKI
ncbi:MAG: hypothetical protein HGB35_02650 [Geobacteraceae bacterium]|nr:hypothetical protein [Geobacteraceae bacterium]